jgi:hypothetical protein
MRAFYDKYGPCPSPLSPAFDHQFWRIQWHLVMADDQTVALRGAETVCHYCEGDAKVNFSFISRITADGSKLLMILIAKGRIDRCHNQLGSHDFYIYDV